LWAGFHIGFEELISISVEFHSETWCVTWTTYSLKVNIKHACLVVFTTNYYIICLDLSDQRAHTVDTPNKFLPAFQNIESFVLL